MGKSFYIYHCIVDNTQEAGMKSIYVQNVQKYEEKEEHPEAPIEEDKTTDRKTDFKEVYIVEVSEISFYCQYKNSGSKLNALQAKMAQEMAANPPLPGAYSPKKGIIRLIIFLLLVFISTLSRFCIPFYNIIS